MADYIDKNGLQELLNRIQVSGGGSKTKEGTQVGGRLGLNIPIDESSDIGIGASGHYAKGKDFSDKGIDRADIAYKKGFSDGSEFRIRAGANLNDRAGKRGVDEIGAEYEIPFKKGGRVKKKISKSHKPIKKTTVSKASKRGDGIARKGKTKGRVI